MNNKGQMLIEAALILPFLFLLLFGIVDLSRYFYTLNSVCSAAGAGARAASLQVPPPTGVQSGQLSSPANSIERAISSNLFTYINLDEVTYDLTITDSSGNVVTRAAQSGDQITVTVRWPKFTMITPLISRMIPADATGAASMRYE
ncbi:MAG TPA: TadE/TadG family type IV pilus assembly protein [Geomonas sp.]|nr:TadE/TadG family type IV pilus assembly protein [Geomonas sp.]